MKKKVVLLAFLSVIALCCFCFGCTSKDDYGLEKLGDFHIKASVSEYDFKNALETDLDKDEISVDSSAVTFGTVGEYDVVIEYKGQTVTKKCYVYGMPVVEGTPAAVTYEAAVSGEILAGVTAKDSFGNALSVSVSEGLQKDSLGRISYGNNTVVYSATDLAGNTATSEKQITVTEEGRPAFTDVSVDIADGNFSLALENMSSVRVAVGGRLIPETDYSARNGVLILYDRYMATLDHAVAHEVTIIDETTGWNSFELSVADAKPLNYDAPIGDGFTYAAGKISLPSVEIGNPLQQHSISYSLGKTGETPVDLGDAPVLEHGEIGEYDYTIRIERKDEEIFNKTYKINIVSEREYDSIIFNADSEQFMGNMYVDETLDMPSRFEYRSADFGGKYTDSAEVTKNAARFNKLIEDMNYQRDLYITEEAIERMLAAGYKTLTIEFCFVAPEGTPQIQVLGNTTGKNGDQWTNVENNKWTSVLFNMSNLYENYREGMSGMFGGFRFLYQPGDGNKPFQVYISSIKAGYLYQGSATYAGTYTGTSENSITILSDGTAQIFGDNAGNYTVSVTDDHRIRFESNALETEGYVDAGILILGDNIYINEKNSEYSILEGQNSLPEFASVFAAAGYETEYYTVEDGTDTLLSDLNGIFTAGQEISLKVKISKDGQALGQVIKTIFILNEYEYYSQNLATEANKDKFILHGPANSVYPVSVTDKVGTQKDGLCFVNTYTDGSNSYVFTLDKAFVQGALKAGFTGVKLMYNIPVLGEELRLGEWLNTGGWDWQSPLGYASASPVWQNDNKWETMSMQKSFTTLAEDSTLLIHLNAPGSFYIADFSLIKTVPTDAEFEEDFSSGSAGLLYLWQYDARNSVVYESHTDKNGVTHEGLHIVNSCYQNTDSSRTFTLGAEDLVNKAKELGYTKVKFDICLPVLNTEMFGPGSFYFGASPTWSNDNVWESKEVSLSDLSKLDMTFTGQDAYIANLRFTKA